MYVRITTRFVFSNTSHLLLKWAMSVKPIKPSCYTRITLTYSMQQSPSWEANQFLASQEIPRILWNPKVYHQVYKNQPSVPILSQIIPLPGDPSTPGPSKWSLSLKFLQSKTLYTTLLYQYVPHSPPISFSWSNRPNNICWGVQIIKLLIM